MAQFTIPTGMKPDEVAKTLSAYLLGARAFENPQDAQGHYRHGPHMEKGGPGAWQLDGSNNYWFTIDANGVATLGCRYIDQQRIVAAMLVLFNLRHTRSR